MAFLLRSGGAAPRNALLEGDLEDHLAPTLPRLHLLKPLAPRDEGADARRPEHFVRGKDVEIAAEAVEGNRKVGSRLCAIHQSGYPLRARKGDELGHRIDRAEHIGNVRESEEPHRIACEHPGRPLEVEHALLIHGHGHEPRAASAAEHLPRHEVAVVVHRRDQHHLARLQPRREVSLRHQIHGLGGAPCEHHATRIGGPKESGEGRSCALVELRRLDRKGVHPAVHIRIVRTVEAIHRLEHAERFLGGGRIVEIDQRLAVHLPAEGRKLLAHELEQATLDLRFAQQRFAQVFSPPHGRG